MQSLRIEGMDIALNVLHLEKQRGKQQRRDASQRDAVRMQVFLALLQFSSRKKNNVCICVRFAAHVLCIRTLRTLVANRDV